MDDRTRDRGSYSNLSDSGRRAAARPGQRRRSTVEVGRSDLVSVPRSTSKHGRDGCYRATTTHSDVPLYAAATDAQVAEAAADARAAVFMLRLYVVRLVFFVSFTSNLLGHPLSQSPS